MNTPQVVCSKYINLAYSKLCISQDDNYQYTTGNAVALEYESTAHVTSSARSTSAIDWPGDPQHNLK